MAMTNDNDSCKLCDERLICLNSITLQQRIVEYTGYRVSGRKFPTLSSPDNIILPNVEGQKVFMFGGYNTMYKYIDDEGYYMYDIESNEMSKIPVDKSMSHLFMRSQHTVNTLAVPNTDPKV